MEHVLAADDEVGDRQRPIAQVDRDVARAGQVDVVGVRDVRDVARAQAVAGAAHQDRENDRLPDVRMPYLPEVLGVGEAGREERLRERIAGVEVADDGEELARLDRSQIGGGDLHVDAVEHRQRPGGSVIGEHRRGAGGDRLVVGGIEQCGAAALQFRDLRRQQLRELPEGTTRLFMCVAGGGWR